MEVEDILLKWVIPDIKSLILDYIMETFQIKFSDDIWNKDKNYKYLTINAKSLDEVIMYLQKHCKDRYNYLMYNNHELSIWQHKDNGNIILWYNTFGDSEVFDLSVNRKFAGGKDKEFKEGNFIKNSGGSQKSESDRLYKKIKIEDINWTQFKNLTLLILKELCDEYDSDYLMINYKVNDKFVEYPVEYGR